MYKKICTYVSSYIVGIGLAYTLRIAYAKINIVRCEAFKDTRVDIIFKARMFFCALGGNVHFKNVKKKENNIMPKIVHVVVRDVKELSSAAHNVQRKTIYKSITNEIYYP